MNVRHVKAPIFIELIPKLVMAGKTAEKEILKEVEGDDVESRWKKSKNRHDLFKLKKRRNKQ